MLARRALSIVRLPLIAGLIVAAVSAPAVAAESASEPASARTYFGLPTGRPVVAAGLSLAVSGWGQHYNGDPEKGNMMLASLATFPVAWGLDSLTGGAMMRVFSYAIIVGVKGWSVYDAYHHARPTALPPTALPPTALPPAADVAP